MNASIPPAAADEAGRLAELNAKLPQVRWFVRKRPTDDGLAVIEDGLEHGLFPITGEWPEIEFIVALVNAYRAGAPTMDEGKLRNLRLRLESALENRRQEGDGDAVAWLSEGVQALTDALAGRLVPATPTQSEDARDERLWWFLTILNGMGGKSDAGDYAGNWLNTFCNDRPSDPDTFNLALNLKLTESSHDSDTDESRVWLTDAGKTWLAASAWSDLPRIAYEASNIGTLHWDDLPGTGKALWSRVALAVMEAGLKSVRMPGLKRAPVEIAKMVDTLYKATLPINDIEQSKLDECRGRVLSALGWEGLGP